MKANEAPDKIFLPGDIDWPSAAILTLGNQPGDVEYIRTDAFIEKAVEWLSANADKYIWYSDYAENIGDDTCGMNDDFIEDFKDYMKGE